MINLKKLKDSLFGIPCRHEHREFDHLRGERLDELTALAVRTFRELEFYKAEEFTDRWMYKRVRSDLHTAFEKIQSDGLFTEKETDLLRYGFTSFLNQYIGFNSLLIDSVGCIEKSNIPWMRLFAALVADKIKLGGISRLNPVNEQYTGIIDYMFDEKCGEIFYFSKTEAGFYKSCMIMLIISYVELKEWNNNE